MFFINKKETSCDRTSVNMHQTMFSLAGLEPSEAMWGSVFGGGAKQLVRVMAMTSPYTMQQYGAADTVAQPQAQGTVLSAAAAAIDVAKQRVRLHHKLLQHVGTPAAVGGGMTGFFLSQVWYL